jgi:hypothetical protein
MGRNKWRDYVLSITDGDPQVQIHQKTGIDTATISRWLNPNHTRRPGVTPDTARKISAAYDRPVIEVLLHAGILSEEEAGMRADPPPALADIPTEVIVKDLRRLILELSRRMADQAATRPKE